MPTLLLSHLRRSTLSAPVRTTFVTCLWLHCIIREPKIYMDEFELLITNVEGGFGEDSGVDENTVEDGVLIFEERLRMTSQCQCETAHMQLKLCVNQHSKKDRIFRATGRRDSSEG